jgi:predicted PurR-regulated permease PerM
MRPTQLRFVLAPSAIVVVFGAIIAALVLRNVFVAARRPLGWAIAALVMAAAIEPTVSRVSRHMRRGLALICVLVPLIAAVAFIGRGVYEDLDRSIGKLQEALPEAAGRIEQSHRFGDAAKELDLRRRAQEFADDLEKPSSAVAGEAVGSGGAWLVTTILMIFALGWGPRFGDAALAQIEDERRRDRVARVVGRAFTQSQGYVDTALAQGLLVGGLAWVLYRLFDVPAPTPLAVLTGLLSVVPVVGIVVGALPAIMLVAGFDSFGQATAMLAIVVGAQVVQAILYRGLVRRTLYVGPGIIVIAYLLGSGIYGVGGAVVSTAIAVFVVALLDANAAERGTVDQPPDAADPTLDRPPADD